MAVLEIKFFRHGKVPMQRSKRETIKRPLSRQRRAFFLDVPSIAGVFSPGRKNLEAKDSICRAVRAQGSSSPRSGTRELRHENSTREIETLTVSPSTDDQPLSLSPRAHFIPSDTSMAEQVNNLSPELSETEEASFPNTNLDP